MRKNTWLLSFKSFKYLLSLFINLGVVDFCIQKYWSKLDKYLAKNLLFRRCEQETACCHRHERMPLLQELASRATSKRAIVRDSPPSRPRHMILSKPRRQGRGPWTSLSASGLRTNDAYLYKMSRPPLDLMTNCWLLCNSVLKPSLTHTSKLCKIIVWVSIILLSKWNI